jgi:hypothetical protein
MSIEGYQRRVEIFEAAARLHPDLMEPWVTRVADILDDAEASMRLMRVSLAATFRQRYPMPPGVEWPEPPTPRQAATA